MTNRWIGITSVIILLAVDGALLLRDVVPSWTAGDPPRWDLFDLPTGVERGSKLGLYNADGVPIGECWTVANRRSAENLTFNVWYILRGGELAGLALPRLFILTEMQFDRQERLSSLHIRVSGLDIPMEFKGEFFEPNDFLFTWKVAQREGTFQMPADSLGAYGDYARPFDDMRNLKIGQRWRMQIFNPLAGLLPNFGASGLAGDSLLVQVTRQERIRHNNEWVDALVVEADRIRAWVAPSGRILQQETTIPVLGTIWLIDEPYDDDQRKEHTRNASR